MGAEDFAGLSAVLKDADSCYVNKKDSFELVEGLDEHERVKLSEGLDDLLDLWIIDNGSCMSPDTIEKSWMVIGTDSKEVKAKSEGGRILTGAKGIGRFALDRLGQKCEL